MLKGWYSVQVCSDTRSLHSPSSNYTFMHIHIEAHTYCIYNKLHVGTQVPSYSSAHKCTSLKRAYKIVKGSETGCDVRQVHMFVEATSH